MSYNAGALVFMIQSVGQQAFEANMASLDRSVEKAGRSASEAAPKVDAVGDAADKTSKKAKDAKAPLEEIGRTSKEVAGQSETLAEQISRVEEELKAEGNASETLKQKLSALKAEQAAQEQAAREQAAAAKELSKTLLVAGAASAAVVSLSVAKYTEFDEAMSQTSAALIATREEQVALGESALEAGADTAFSASEAANAQEELAKAGQSVADIVGGSLNGALSLAAAGQLEVARSAEIMATTLTQFRLPASEAAHVADVLAAGAGKAQGEVEDMALALSYVGPVSAGLKISLEETGGAIAYLASQGIIGEKAGTSLRGVLMSLTAPSAIAARTMAEYGIEIFDAEGNMKSLATVSEILKRQLGDLTEAERSQALGRIFGNEQITAARILYAGGSAAIKEWTAAVDDSGYAAQQASMRQDNLAGDIEKLGGALDTALIRTGAPANDVLREMVQAVTALVDWYGELPAPVQTTAVVLGVATGAALLFSGAAIGVRGRLIEMQAEFAKVNASMRTTALVGAGAGIALAGIITIVGLLAAAQAEATARAEGYADALERGGNAARELVTDALTAEQSFLWISKGSAADAAEKFGISLKELGDAALGDADALASMNDVLAAGRGDQEAAQRLADAHGLSLLEVSSASTLLAETLEREQIAQQQGAETRRQANEITEEGAEVTQTAAEAYIDATKGARDLDKQLRELIDTINEANGTGQDAITANIGYQDALRGVDEQIQKVRDGEKGYAYGLDITTDAGARNKEMLVGLAEDAQKAAEAQYALDGNTDAYRATLEASRQTLIDRAQDLGASAEEAAELADQIFRIPSATEWEVIAKTQQATTQIAQFIADAEQRVIRIGMSTYTKDGPDGGLRVRDLNTGLERFADGAVVKYFANGGTEHHVAQMARAGSYRVWAEPETGGESYIPHAPSKRARSEQIMSETAALLGGTYIPAGAKGYADGATVAVPAQAGASGAPPIHIDASGLTFAEVRSIVEEIVQRYFG